MFKDVIRETPLYNPAANQFFEDKITGSAYSNDVSFISTLRALVGSRIGDDSLDLTFSHSTYDKESAEYAREKSPVTNMMEYAIANCIGVSVLAEKGRLNIHNLSHPREEANEAWIEIFTHLPEAYPDWVRVEKVTNYYSDCTKGKMHVLCFVNPSLKSTLVITPCLDIHKMHILQTGITVFLPWYFPSGEKKVVTEKEYQLINSFKESTPAMYMDCITEIARQYDFRSAHIRSCLGDFEVKAWDRERTSLETEVTRCNNQIDEYTRRITDLLRAKREYDTRLYGIITRIAQSKERDSALMQYFMENTALSIARVDGLNIDFYVKTDLVMFGDEDEVEECINDDYSYIYRPDGDSLDHIIKTEDMRRLMTAIFIDRTLKMRVCTFFKFSAAGEVSAPSKHIFGWEFNDATPNPHHYHFHCIGDYVADIVSCLQKYDYIGALSKCVMSCGSINMHEQVTISHLMECLYGVDTNVNNRCIVLPDGRVVTPKEAIEYLKEEGANE